MKHSVDPRAVRLLECAAGPPAGSASATTSSPATIRRALADTFIVALDEPAGHPFRIAGTRVCALFGRDLKQEPFLDLWSPQSRAHGGRPVRRRRAGIDRLAGRGRDGRPAMRATHSTSNCSPCRSLHEGRTDARVLGALAPVRIPVWVGASALGNLALGTFRYVGPAVKPECCAPLAIAARGRTRPRHGLVVYDGGLATAEIGSPSTG